MFEISITIADVAKAAKVSVTSVSYVINNVPKVSPSTRERVLRVMEDLNYRPSRTARSLAGSSSNAIGLVIPSITAPFYLNMVRSIEEEVQKRGFVLNICMSRAEGPRERAAIDMLRDGPIDGMVLMTYHAGEEYIASLKSGRLPFVCIGEPILDEGISTIRVNNWDIGYKATEALLRMGHRRIAMLAGLEGEVDSDERVKGYLSALASWNVPVDERLVKSGTFGKESGYLCAKEWLTQKGAPTAIFAANDLMAIGVLEACHEMNIKVPDALSVIGVDDIEAASLVQPKLSTVRQPTFMMGELAMKILIEMIEDRDYPAQKLLLSTELVLRESCAPPRE